MADDNELGRIIGRNIRKYRQLAGLTQTDLAVRAGVSREVVAKLELGRSRQPTLSIVMTIAGALGVRVEDLVADQVFEAPIRPLVEKFLASDLCRIAKVSEIERQWLLSLPTIRWMGAGVPSEETIYKLLEAYRTTKG